MIYYSTEPSKYVTKISKKTRVNLCITLTVQPSQIIQELN